MLAPETIFQNRYRVVRRIGGGGMGDVYLAVDLKFDSPVALKQNFFNDDRLSKAFEREARTLNRLRHPALPRVIDHFTEDGVQFLVMEFIPGHDLGEILQQRHDNVEPRGQAKPFENDEVLAWADQLLDALHYLHGQQQPVIHRDIKPQNLKVAERSQIVLLDFGLAKVAPINLSRVTSSGSILGYTASYAPLEQIQGGGTDPRSDIYSLGATLYHLLTGAPPVDALTRAAHVLEGKADPLKLARDLNQRVPIAVANVLRQAMALNRHQRPTDATQMRENLHQASQSSHPVTLQLASEAEHGRKKANRDSGKLPGPVSKGEEQTELAPPLDNAIVDTNRGHREMRIPVEEPAARPPDDYYTRRMAEDQPISPSPALGSDQPAGARVAVPSVIADESPPYIGETGAMEEVRQRPSDPASVNSQNSTSGRQILRRVALTVVALIGLTAIGVWAFRSREPKAPVVERTYPATGSSPGALGALPLRGFEFDVVTVNSSGAETSRRKGQAQYCVEDTAGISLGLVPIPGGTFTMGSSSGELDRTADEGPQHQVSVQPFYMGKYEVTQAQWRAVAGLPKVARDLNSDPSNFKGDNLPVEHVSWENAVEFCARLSRATGRTYRLPTEAEWEYACRGATTTPFAFGQAVTPQLVNYNGNYPYAQASKGTFRKTTTPAGFMGVANGFGLFDMHGNVYEWCMDYWHESYNGAPTDGSSWETAGDTLHRVLRGGSWHHNGSRCRSAARLGWPPGSRSDLIGFRVVGVPLWPYNHA